MTLAEIRKEAEEGSVSYQCLLGHIYSSVYFAKSYGAVLDATEGVKWYRKAAEQGHADAQNRIGNAYSTGNGVAQDYVEAAKWYRKAVEQGHSIARRNLAHCYYTGQGMEKTSMKLYVSTN